MTPTQQQIKAALDDLKRAIFNNEDSRYIADLFRVHAPTVFSILQQAIDEGMVPCVSCGKPGETSTEDGAEMCWECHSGFLSSEYFAAMKMVAKMADLLNMRMRISTYYAYKKYLKTHEFEISQAREMIAAAGEDAP